MTEEFKELYDMLSSDRPEVRELKDKYEKELSVLLNKVRSYKVDNIDIKSDYDITEDFAKYQLDDINLRHNIELDLIQYKIAILQGYLQDLFSEKKFAEFKRTQEQQLSKDEYLVYTNNPEYQAHFINAWYQDFMEK